MKKETKTIAFEIKAIGDSDDEKFFTFEGYASTFGNKDLGDDIILSGAFKTSLQSNKEVPILWQHNMSSPIGKSVELFEDEKGLYIKAILPKDDDLVKGRVIPQMRIGSIKEMSIGYFVKDSDYKDEVRLLKEVELFEVSLVTKAMNPRATVTSMKSLEESTEIKDVESILKDNGFSNKEAKTIISKIKEITLQRDAEEKKIQRDADVQELKTQNDIKEAVEALKQFTNSIKLNK